METLSKDSDEPLLDHTILSDLATSTNSSNMILTLDEALEYNEPGFYQYRLLLLCGFAFMADALEVNLLSFVSVCAGKEWSLSNAEEASITAVVFIGIVCGSGFWGVLSDWYGRKRSFLYATALISVGGVLTGFATSFPLLLLFRGLVGFGIGGANVPFDLLAELLPASQRGSFLIYIEFFWTFGSVMVAGLAWGFLTQEGWRLLALITVIPVAVTSLFSILYLPESPRWLMSVGRNVEAEQVLIDAAKVNGKTMPSFHLRDDSDKHGPKSIDYLDILKDKKMRKITIPLWLVWAGFGCTYFGTVLFITRLYSKDGNDESKDEEDNGNCSFNYSLIFYNALSEIVAVAFNGFFLENVGRIKMQIIFYLLAGIMVFLMGFDLPSGGLITVGIIGRIAVMIASVCRLLCCVSFLTVLVCFSCLVEHYLGFNSRTIFN
jgi:MFS family permease